MEAIEYEENAVKLAEAQNKDAMEEVGEESEEPQETRMPQEKKVDWGTGFLMGMVGLFFGVLSIIPVAGLLFNGAGLFFIWLWWVTSGLKPPTTSVLANVPIWKKGAQTIDPTAYAGELATSVPVLGKFLAFFLPAILGIIPGSGILFLPGLVWAIYRANS